MDKIKFPSSSSLSFSSVPMHYDFNSAIVMGVCRSGKTTLCNLLATCENVENADEPWTAKILPLLIGLGKIDEAIGRQIFMSFITELMNDMILLRRANFRPGDLSSILLQKNEQEIYNRLNLLETREDVKKFKDKNSPLLLLNLTEVMPFIDFFFETVTGVRMIHVVRNGKDVAYDALTKGWFSDKQLSEPRKALPYNQFKNDNSTLHLPWWVSQGDEELFVSYTEYDRCIYYWCQNIQSILTSNNISSSNSEYITVYYEDLISKSQDTFYNTAAFLNVKPTSLSEKALADFDSRPKAELNNKEIYDEQLMLRFKLLNEELNDIRP
jgi:hypothetical protein